MNKLFATAGLALVMLGAGCAPSSGPVYISRFMPVQPDCTADIAATTFISGGTLDVGAGSPSYFVGVELAGGDIVKTAPVSVGSTELEPMDRDRPIINEFVLTYATTPSLPGLREVKIPRIIEMDKLTGFSQTYLNLIGTDAATVLQTIGPTDVISLKVSVTANGYMSGSGTRITTGAIVFPIKVVQLHNTCGTKGVKQANACEFPGQALPSVLPDTTTYVCNP